MKIKKKIPLIDQHDKNGMYAQKFGGSYVPETLKKPIEDYSLREKQIVKNDMSKYKLKKYGR